MKSLLTLITSLIFYSQVFAAEAIKFNFNNEEITKIVEAYSKASSQKFVVDSTVRGKVTLLNPTAVSLDDAYNQLSEALAINGYGIITQGDTLTIKNARSTQRDNIAVSTELPAAKPQRMATWVINLKFVKAADVLQDIRMFTSSYGEINSFSRNNQLIISDWTSNLQRVAEIIKQVDIQK